MNRRTFLKAAGSFAILLPWLGQKAFAQGLGPYPGPFLMCINAEGGWDTTMFFDPKLGNFSKNGRRINSAYDKVAAVGPFSYGVVDFEYTANGNTLLLHSHEAFLKAYGSRLLLLNGVDVETNAHPVGNQRVWSGHVATDYPAIGALLAAKASQTFDLPCAYVVDSGAYIKTRGLVPLSRVDAGGMRSLAYETKFPRAGGSQLFTPETSRRIAEANRERTQKLESQLFLPGSKTSLRRYDKAMLAKSGLEPLAERLPSAFTPLNTLRPGAGTALDTTLQQAELALYGFATGTMASASISLGGFDSHSSNNSTQKTRLGHLFVLLEHILNKASALEVSNLYVLVGSDFARPPFYVGTGDTAGKDHWNVSSYMLFGPKVNGGRVLGKTTNDLYAQPVNPQAPETPLPENQGGVVLKPSHLHYELRELLDLSEFNTVYKLADGKTLLNANNRVRLF